MARGPLRDREDKKQEALEKIEYHKRCIVKLEQQVKELSKPKVSKSKSTKKQEILKEMVDSGKVSMDDAVLLGYKVIK